MSNKLGFWLIWILFSVYAFIFAPPDRPDTLQLILKLSTGDWQSTNALIVALFNLMGVFPFIYACMLVSDGRGQKVPAWLFASLSFLVGAFALLPYFALREPNPTFIGKKNRLISALESRWTGIGLTAIAFYFLVYGFANGNWADFVQQWQTSRFIHVMTLDFCMLSLLFPWLLSDDMERRGMTDDRFFTFISLVPLVGALIYLCLRSPLIESEQESAV
ncbi:MAG: DUF2834 domain-containing protein [Pseudanabaena sp.]|jgi:hypothetical protein|uniref:DUF2834 domain-containing protein n=1 Tax=Pseudanabaena mucicola TaxID=71190 RepID=UPI0025770182|nr:DUF2834 domain-containing protein [Pseudanabaena mucicola]MCA6575646.1 DUF2834 domain-containing protein [Pseudanabaena sp. M53BS1SP1A06MG]MCA6583637.1 DUF2834 domain-containing protein [Pseudanabaena sp. M34BS1SP1A06MG]MCA6587105.1 DUF2834 domain-containing protein [Pseudanabaena sp. M051S1SP1A06QC]MCA6588474.1 DUF2834 domain-containing protein [Pseudanabaena sp. M109S1SP1A06QC]MCA6590764.1 DUF2834 domain-containing protein [Pseudanabaena sp. M38BS1SP1A06MG]MCA6598714.1 DUF2834 domain-con